MSRHLDALDEFLTPAAVAAILYVDPKTVTRWAVAGKIDSIRTPGGHRRFRRSDVMALLSGMNHQSSSLRPSVARSAAAAVVAEAAARAQEARTLAATEAARVVAGDAARSAAAVQARAEGAAARVADAAARAALTVSSSGPANPGGEPEVAALRVAATVEAAADAQAQETTVVAASMATAVAEAAARVAMTVTAEDIDLEKEVASAAKALEDSTARRSQHARAAATVSDPPRR